jgi:Dynein heavy chain, N-terminal region 2
MEKKRGSFPRFYFLSNDELIDILANSNNLEIVQQHLKTCFDNLVKIDVSEGELSSTPLKVKKYPLPKLSEPNLQLKDGC